MKLDGTDLKILDALQNDGALSSAQVAERIGSTQSPTWRRMSQLDSDGVIKERVAIVDRHKVGLSFMVYVFIRLKDQTYETVTSFEEHIAVIDEITHCHMLMGDIDFLLLVVSRDLAHYHRLLREQISIIPGISGIDSRVVVEEAKSTTRLPLITE